MKQTQNQYYGKDINKSNLRTVPVGSTYIATDTNSLYFLNESKEVVSTNTYLSLVDVNNDENVGFTLDINKENTSGAGFKSNVYGIKNYTKANSSEIVVNIAGTWSKAEHIGTGRTYFITGATNRAYHSGEGNSNVITGTFSEGKVIGTGSGDHSYVVGVNSKAVIDNPNATIDFLQGQHCTIEVADGDVTDNAMCLILDLDHTGGNISGDFEYLRIQNDTFDSPIGGTARAIHSLSVFPSEFGGSIQAENFIDTGVAEYTDNAAAIAAGLAVGTHYRTGDLLKIVH